MNSALEDPRSEGPTERQVARFTSSKKSWSIAKALPETGRSATRVAVALPMAPRPTRPRIDRDVPWETWPWVHAAAAVGKGGEGQSFDRATALRLERDEALEHLGAADRGCGHRADGVVLIYWAIEDLGGRPDPAQPPVGVDRGRPVVLEGSA